MNTRRNTRRTLIQGNTNKNKLQQNGVRRRRVNNTRPNNANRNNRSNRPNRPNRRYYQKFRKNRLQRVQNVLGYNRSNYRNPRPNYNYNRFPSAAKPNNKLFNKANQNGNLNYDKRVIYIKGLPRYVDNKGLFNLFRNEGRIAEYKVLYDNFGFSRGIGKIAFVDFRDAWKAINKWNNSSYKGFTLKLEYKKMKNNQNGANSGNNLVKAGNNNNYGRSSNYTKFNGYSGNYNGNRNNYNYNNYGYSRYKY